MGISFTKRLRPGIRAGEITTSIRVWMSPRVRVGERYPMDGGAVRVTRLVEIDLDDVTDEMARAGGFTDLDDMMLIAKHGRGERIFLVEFEFEPGWEG